MAERIVSYGFALSYPHTKQPADGIGDGRERNCLVPQWLARVSESLLFSEISQLLRYNKNLLFGDDFLTVRARGGEMDGERKTG